MLDFVRAHDVLLGWLGGVSLLMFLGALIAVPILAVRLPADYFAPPKRTRRLHSARHPVVRIGTLAAKNLLGAILVLAGISMLVLPGQGILTIAIGIALMDFPGKYRLERWMIRRRWLLRPINGLRRKMGAEPLKFGPNR
jgi:hypothetical protein